MQQRLFLAQLGTGLAHLVATCLPAATASILQHSNTFRQLNSFQQSSRQPQMQPQQQRNNNDNMFNNNTMIMTTHLTMT